MRRAQWRKINRIYLPILTFRIRHILLVGLVHVTFMLLLHVHSAQSQKSSRRQQTKRPQQQAPQTTPMQPMTPTQPVNSKLTLKVCCGDDQSHCEEFQRPEEMFGIACCGVQPINEFEEICCDGVTRRRRQQSSYVEGCCGNQTLSYDQTCCQGVVHNVPNGECCGSQAYPRNNINILCCNGVLNVNVEPGLTCCGTTPYDGGLRETCCGDSVFLKELFDGCCPVYGSNPPEYRQFNSRTHQCCDVPIERYSTTKCCYLSDSTSGVHDKWHPKSYDSATSCCVYPFTAIAPKNAAGTCARVTAPPRPPATTTPVGNAAITTPTGAGNTTPALPNVGGATGGNNGPSEANEEEEEEEKSPTEENAEEESNVGDEEQ